MVGNRWTTRGSTFAFRCALATLDIKSSIGPTFHMKQLQMTHALVQGTACQVFGHHVCGVLNAQHFSELKLIGILLFFYPQAVDVDVPELAGSLAFCNGKGGARVCIDHASTVHNKVFEKTGGSQEFRGSLD